MGAWRMRGAAMALAAMASVPAFAGGDLEDAKARIRELEHQMQQMGEQLKAVQEQLARNGQVAPAEAKPVEGSPVRASFRNGLLLRDDTGDWALRMYARAQLDYRRFSPDAFAADTFSLRRARIGAIATFFEDFTLRIEGEYADGITKLNDGYLDYTHFKSAMIRVGQFKTMYGLERAQGAMDLNFMERALTEGVLGSVFDRGVMLFGSPVNGLYYNLAYVNGTGQNVDESSAGTDGKDWSLRVVGNAAEWMGWQDSVVHVGGFHVRGRQADGSAMPALRTEGRGMTFFSTTNGASKDTLAGDFDRTLSGFESALAYGPVKYQGEYIHANYDGTGFDRDMSAWYASLQWLVTGEHYADFYKNAAFLGVRPKNDFRYGNGGWGALELGVRFSAFDAGDFVTTNADGTGKLAAGLTNGAGAWTLGAKWILNPNAQVQLNFVHTNFDTPILLNGHTDDYENAMNMRVQFDF